MSATMQELVKRDELTVIPGVFDAMTAKLAEDVGFEGLYLGGYVVGSSIAASEPLTTMTEMCDQAGEITAATDLPLIVDGNAGFGNPSHTYRTIRQYDHAGIDALHIEDQVYPKRMHYFATADRQGRKHVIDTEEMQQKVRAAVEAKEAIDSDITIITRSDTARDQRREFETMEDAVERINAYFDAGADMGLLFPADREEARYVAEHADGPMLYVMLENRLSTDERPSVAELEEMGYAMAAYPIGATVLAAHYTKRMYESLRETGETGIEKETFAETRNEINRVIGLHDYYDIEERSGKK